MGFDCHVVRGFDCHDHDLSSYLELTHSLDPRLLRFKFLRFPFFFFFFFMPFPPTGGTVHVRYMNSSRNF